MALNKAMIIGNLGQKPEVKFTPQGQAVCQLSVATNDSYTDKAGQKVEKVEWHRVNVWGKLAENCGRYLDKGRPVYVEGKLGTRKWTDKNGVERYTTEITANTVQFLGSGTGEGGGARPPHPADQAGAAPHGAADTGAPIGNIQPPADSEDIPF